MVRRDEFDAVKAMADKARAENDALALRLTALEAKLGDKV
jgi:BMFP domain-containing protein YqiC